MTVTQASSETTTITRAKTVYVETYGCQMNKADSELITGLLKCDGYRVTDDAEQADVILVNTCAIRENAERRVLGRMSELNRLKHANPELVLGLCGCMSQHLGEKILDQAPYIDLVAGPDTYRGLPDMLRALDHGHDPALSLSWDRVARDWQSLVEAGFVRSDRCATTEFGYRYLDSVVGEFMPR